MVNALRRVLAGARWSPAAFAKHCEAHIAEDFPACAGFFVQNLAP